MIATVAVPDALLFTGLAVVAMALIIIAGELMDRRSR